MARQLWRSPPDAAQRAKMARQKAEYHREHGSRPGIAEALEKYAAACDRETEARKDAESAWTDYLRALTGKVVEGGPRDAR